MKKTQMMKILLVFCFFLAMTFFGCKEDKPIEITEAEQLNSAEMVIGVEEGTPAALSAKTLFPLAEIKYFKSAVDGYTALKTSKISAFFGSKIYMQFAVKGGLREVEILEENFPQERIDICFGIRKNSKYKKQIDNFIEKMRNDGTLDQMYDYWVRGIGERAVVPVPKNPRTSISVGTSGVAEPFSYYENNVLTGYDIELLQRLGLYLNAEINIRIYDYSGIITALESGEIDIVAAFLMKTNERMEKIDFSRPILHEDIKLMVRDTNDESPAFTKLSDFDGEKMGILTGSAFDRLADSAFENLQKEYYNNFSDMIVAVEQGKIAGIIMDEPTAKLVTSKNQHLKYLPERISRDEYAYMLSKNTRCDVFRNQLDEFITELETDGTLQELKEVWFGNDESKKIVDFNNLNVGKKGTFNVAVFVSTEPFVYVSNGEIIGYEIDILARFCRKYGYALKIQSTEISSMISAVVSGKFDCGAACFAITDERKENVNFTKSHYDGGAVVLTKVDDIEAVKDKKGFLTSFAESFEKNFIREERWRMILSGLWITIIIALATMIFGTILGFGLCFAKISHYKLLSQTAAFLIRLIQGTPIVVLLMILYYVVFSGNNINAIIIAVIGFSIDFAAYVSEMFRSGIEGVDRGQREASFALGFNQVQTFWKIIMPQAARHIIPVYKGEFISMVKMTSVVGYIAVQDLTKVSDIIRSRTYEAFFPLIATAIIYFGLTYLATLGIGLLEKRIDPKSRKKQMKLE